MREGGVGLGSKGWGKRRGGKGEGKGKGGRGKGGEEKGIWYTQMNKVQTGLSNNNAVYKDVMYSFYK